MADPFSFVPSGEPVTLGDQRPRSVPARWPQLPVSANIQDERGNNQWVRAMLDNVGLLPRMETLGRVLTHPFSRVPHWADEPLLPQGPLSRAAGYDDIRPEELAVMNAPMEHMKRKR